MKKLLLLLLVLFAFMSIFVGCDKPDVADGTTDVPGDTTDDTPHEHNFVFVNETQPTCTAAGALNYECSCGEKKVETGSAATGHNFVFTSEKQPTCTEAGVLYYECTCGEKKEEAGAAIVDHTFVLTSEKQPTCTAAGILYYECVCGEKKEEPGLEATGHDLEETVLNAPTCGKSGAYKYSCKNCKFSEIKKVGATGEHVYDETTEASRILKCTGPSCSSIKIREFDGKYKDVIVYEFSSEDVDAFNAIYNELDAIISAADAYDAASHAYAPGSDLEALYLEMEAKYEELYQILEYATGQYQIAQIEYYMDMSNAEKEATLDYITEIRTQLVADFYAFSQPIYDSMYREYYYYGMSEEEITAFILDSNAAGNPEYLELVNRNADIELEFYEITSPKDSPKVLALYGEFVANNKRIAEIMGYDNYLEYAYENVYDRDYSYTDVASVVEYVKEYIVPIYIAMIDAWGELQTNGGLTQTDVDLFYAQVLDSFFDNYESNIHLNDYIDLLAFSSNPDKMISFSDELNNLVADGNMFRGDYEGAFVTYLYDLNIPIAYFGPGYDHPFTVVHEFGHYMNEIYNDSKYQQSFDLLEMHSQGNEMLYLKYLDGKLTKKGYQLCETYNFANMLDIIVTALAVDTFEQAIYTDFYEGTYSLQIMADNAITPDEYDMLFKSIIADLGTTGYTTDYYWRYVTLTSPCYYVSYSISALSVIQLYPMAEEDFDAAADAYLKLFTYTDTLESEDAYMTTEEVLEYAGLYSFTDEALYKLVNEYFTAILG